MRTSLSFSSTVLLLPFLAGLTFGRQIEQWPYERLFNEAGLVVIAKAEGTADAKDRFKLEGWNVELIGQETRFVVHRTLKGKAVDENKLKVLHYRLPKGALLENGPMLVSFRHDRQTLHGKINGSAFAADLGKPDYMLFLRARPDGRYEPVSGHEDPALSVKELRPAQNALSLLDRS